MLSAFRYPSDRSCVAVWMHHRPEAMTGGCLPTNSILTGDIFHHMFPLCFPEVFDGSQYHLFRKQNSSSQIGWVLLFWGLLLSSKLKCTANHSMSTHCKSFVTRQGGGWGLLDSHTSKWQRCSPLFASESQVAPLYSQMCDLMIQSGGSFNGSYRSRSRLLRG